MQIIYVLFETLVSVNIILLFCEDIYILPSSDLAFFQD